MLFVVADVVSAVLIRATGQSLQNAYSQSLKSLELVKLSQNSGSFDLCIVKCFLLALWIIRFINFPVIFSEFFITCSILD